MTQPPLPSVPHPSVQNSSHRNRNTGIVALAIGLVVGLALGIFISPIVLPKQTGAGTNNQVQVSGTVSVTQTGQIEFASLNDQIQASVPITNGRYSVLVVGNQSYQVYVTGLGISQSYSIYVPLGVTTFTADF